MKEENSTHKGLWFVVLVAVVSHLLPTVSGQGPPVEEECLVYAYTSSEKHNFLLAENSSMFGERLMVIHDCEEVSIYADGFFQASSSNNFSLMIEPGLHNLTIESDGFNASYSNVMFYPDRLEWEIDYNFLINSPQKEVIELELSQTRTNWAVGVGIIIVWVLNVYVYWSLISSYVDRNFIEEVVQ